MTRQDRELAIADNLAYVDGVIDAASREMAATPARLVLAGFSQGVAMAFRAAAAATTRRVDGVIAVGGDVPPEIDAARSPARSRRSSAAARATSGTRTRSSSTTSPRLREAGVTVHAVDVRRRARVVRRAVLRNAATLSSGARGAR